MSKARDIASAPIAPSTVSATELGYVDGVTSAIQTQLDAKTAKATLTTTGDIYYASGANTPARLGIGSSAQVLTVAGGIPSWATPAAGGGMTLLSTTTLSGASTTISSIDQTHKHLYLVLRGVYIASGGQTVSIRFNGDTASNYGFVKQYGRTSDGATTTGGSTSTASPELGDIFTNSNYAQVFNMDMTIPRYTESDKKTMYGLSNGYDSASLTKQDLAIMWNDTSAITSITIRIPSSTFSGGTLYIYGVK